MRKVLVVMMLIFLVLAVSVPQAAAGGRSHHSHSHHDSHISGSIWIGGVWDPFWAPFPYLYPYSYPYPYYYPPQSPVVIERESPVFVAPAPREEQQYWYYCEESNAYYPYVKRCPGGWKKVQPIPESEKE